MDSSELREAVAAYLQFNRTKEAELEELAMAVTAMTFASPPEEQWRMIVESIRQSQDDEDLRHVAAGPIEGFLGRYGKEYIDRVEELAAVSLKFARALTGIRKYKISAEVWSRIQVLQARDSNPLLPPG